MSLNAHAQQGETIRIHNEILDEHRGNGVSVTFRQRESSALPISYGGFSFNTLKSNLALEKENRQRIYPIYGFAGLTLNYPVSPFIEFGLDLGDAIEDKITEGDIWDIDIYYAAGLTFTYRKDFDFSIYHKTYDLYFNEIQNSAMQNVNIGITGISLSLYF